MLTTLAHVTVQETPTGLVIFLMGMVAGSLLTYSLTKLRLR